MTSTEPKTYGEVYVITCTINGKQYVGMTARGVAVRWREHQKRSRKGRTHFYNSIRLYGSEMFTVEVVDGAPTLEELNLRERHWINKLGTLTPSGFNSTTGGDDLSGKRHNPETREKIGAQSRGRKQPPESIEKTRQSNLGRKRTEETKAKMRESWNRTPEGAERIRQAHLGHNHTEVAKAKMSSAARDRAPRQQSTETRGKIAQAHTGMTRSPEAKARMSAAAKNRPPVSPETRAKMSAARKGKPHSPETRAKMAESRRARE